MGTTASCWKNLLAIRDFCWGDLMLSLRESTREKAKRWYLCCFMLSHAICVLIDNYVHSQKIFLTRTALWKFGKELLTVKQYSRAYGQSVISDFLDSSNTFFCWLSIIKSTSTISQRSQFVKETEKAWMGNNHSFFVAAL